MVSQLVTIWFDGERKQEREFKITSEEQIDYTIELIKQSYQTVKRMKDTELQ